jgi:hypothetical protein
LRQKDTIEHRLRKAEILVLKGKYRNSIKIYEKFIEEFPENAEAWNNFGITPEVQADIKMPWSQRECPGHQAFTLAIVEMYGDQARLRYV